jgi:hypothetical protein
VGWIGAVGSGVAGTWFIRTVPAITSTSRDGEKHENPEQPPTHEGVTLL